MNFEIIRILDKNVGVPFCYGLYTLKKLEKFVYNPKATQPKRILILRLWGIGSMILASPTFKAIREKFPDAHITLLTLKRNEGVYEGSGLFNQVLYFNLKDVKSIFFEFLKTLIILRKNKFDLAIDLEPFARFTTILLAMSNIRTKLGYHIEKQGKSMLYDQTVVWNNKQHVSKSFFDITQLLGIKPQELKLEKIPISKQDEDYITILLTEHGIKESDKVIGLNINASDFGTARRWPYQNFAELADRLIKQFKVKIVFVGASFDKEIVDKAINCMPYKGATNAINLTGKTTVKQLAAFMHKCNLFITNDSGPMHIAVAMETPTITFFGPETPLLYGHTGEKHTIFYKHLPCSPCISIYNAKRINCKFDAECIKLITIDEVMEKVRIYLK